MSAVPDTIEPRLLRSFLAVAEELHFTRAAARLYVAQQALSRDIRRLERELGAELFVRTTRRVTLTADGERLLPYARRVLAAQDELVAAFREARPLLVDLNSPGLATGRRVLHRARELAPEQELMARYESGLTYAAAEMLAGRLDVSFGRFAGLDPAVRAGLEQQPVRYEPMALILPEGHRLAALDAVPLAELAGERVYAGAGNPRTPEWTELAGLLFAGRGIEVAPPVPLAVGPEEFERLMAKTGYPVLAVVDLPPLPHTVSRPIVDPVPLSPVSLVWRKGLVHPGLDALRRAAVELARAEVWLSYPADGWIPVMDALIMMSFA
ncbi:LysR family transcriptional regulator [Streptomyces ipomoeae]|jgi:DNA-binding transcriptional LysR family regulator|uniref:Transcriptional regulator, LysR family n=2 Tax=Streptomyces ipomoeae TaxID=103232 RepID=L1KQE6_9ACTN|nr:LysR family transcriptional regulator [Streptomyces ipomoeae]EKX63026.1 transcriptional regulator, LysR family [Streptomyces ipomoeae 91-03]MDX2692993.1 LysR family transcriptional regulator [Streptomyces ipomoeae]MDX2820777.1 LysR family transcriptional regulator [Streptomyces ipomoeae]MDX2838499.1 LysR family transcriptional regulator [Streptomyces ipomoeae]MDX2872555.1 LysR family transcriptional regulator [Streptomyces ipomoeae]